jgi:hypothetical protein
MPLDDFDTSDGSTSDTSGGSPSRSTDNSGGLEAFTGSNSKSSSSGSSSRSGGGGGGNYPHHLVAQSWTGKLDYSKPYILVAESEDSEVYVHQGRAVVMDEHTDWRRMDDHPTMDFRKVYECQSEQAWLRFCSRAQSQLDTDPRDLLAESPLELAELRERVHYPLPVKPNQSRDCRVCGTSSDSHEVTMVEVDLQKHRRVPVCASHTVRELAENGLIE